MCYAIVPPNTKHFCISLLPQTSVRLAWCQTWRHQRGCHEIVQLRMIENQGTYLPTFRFYLYTFNEKVDISHSDWGNVLGEMQAQYFRVARLLQTSLGLITEYI